MDGLAQRIQEQVPPLEEWRKFIYCESMTGKAYGEVDHFAGGPLALGLRPLAQASAACCPAAAQHLSRPATGGRGCSPLRRATQGPRLSRRGAGREALPDATSSPSHPPPSCRPGQRLPASPLPGAHRAPVAAQAAAHAAGRGAALPHRQGADGAPRQQVGRMGDGRMGLGVGRGARASRPARRPACITSGARLVVAWAESIALTMLMLMVRMDCAL
jgi:hypothetical protein